MSVLSPATRSFLSPKSNGYDTDELNRGQAVISSGIPRTYTQSLAQSAKLPHEGLTLSPDELFTKHTVSEVRAVQQRLRCVEYLLPRVTSNQYTEQMQTQSRRNYGLWLGVVLLSNSN